MFRFVLLLVASLLPITSAAAEGFAIQDLRNVPFNASAMEGGRFMTEATPERLTIFCVNCPSLTAVDVLIGRQEDGTEGRVRSGETSYSQLAAQCRQNEPSCTLQELAIEPGVGWVTTYEGPVLPGSTHVVMRNGDLLTIRSIAEDVSTAARNGTLVYNVLAHQIVGAD